MKNCGAVPFAIVAIMSLLLSGCIAPPDTFNRAGAASLRQRILLPAAGETAVPEAGVASTGVELLVPAHPLTLELAVEIALANNPSLRVFAKDVFIGRENVRVARSAFFPQASVTYGYDRRTKPPGMKVPASMILPPEPGMPSTLSLVAGEKQFQRAEVKVQMTLWDFGRTLGTYRQAALGQEIGSLMLDRARQQLRLRVAEAYFNILRARRSRAISEESLEQAKAHLKTAESFAKQGLVDRNDVLQAELQVAEVKQAVIKADHAVGLATSAFNNILGINVNRKTDVLDVTEALPTAIELREALELAVASRPEFRVIQKSIEVQEQRLAYRVPDST